MTKGIFFINVATLLAQLVLLGILVNYGLRVQNARQQESQPRSQEESQELPRTSQSSSDSSFSFRLESRQRPSGFAPPSYGFSRFSFLFHGRIEAFAPRAAIAQPCHWSKPPRLHWPRTCDSRAYRMSVLAHLHTTTLVIDLQPAARARTLKAA